ncbi:MAG: hypothetical protein IKA63_01105 [Clostridia bacterium]|nr:hypothetical protein [Clostridia bacterium]
MKRCFFIGHRETGEEVYPALVKAVEHLVVEQGVTEFIVGKYGNFDRLAAQAVIAVKKQYPQVTLTLLLAYHPAEHPTEKPLGFDTTYYPSEMEFVPRRLAILRANRYVTDRVQHLIAYVRHPASNARDLLEYAQKRGVITLNLADRR